MRTARLSNDGISESDEALMLRYQGGDASAFDILYSRHNAGLFRYFLRQCGDRGEAEELFQDVWMNLIRARSRYQVRAKFTTYLYALAHNRLIDFFRKKSVVFVEASELENVADCTVQLPDERATLGEQVAKLLRLLQALPPPQREAFLLHEEAGLNVEEIAAATGVAKEAAKSRLRYAVQKLREGLRD